MNITSNVKGQLAVSKTELRALELGFLPSRPLFDTRYDLIIDNHESLVRVQIKYADGKSVNSTGVVVTKLEYIDRQKKTFTYKDEEVDALIVYIPKIDKLCYIPKKLFIGKRKLSIRISKSKNNQKKGIIAAEDYYW
ncbi:MAG: group I intron-associated PD-(D/E)XK endonuclease [Candidatus Woesebacteria bacterium]|nr:group I intron-associated PD-(D/E)XK endonuclease [Candidatus Woesebacteria bacterium]